MLRLYYPPDLNPVASATGATANGQRIEIDAPALATGHEFSVESPTSVFAEGDWSLFLQEALPTP